MQHFECCSDTIEIHDEISTYVHRGSLNVPIQYTYVHVNAISGFRHNTVAFQLLSV